MDVILGVYTEDELQDHAPMVDVVCENIQVERLEDTRPVLTEKQANSAIKKIKNGEVELQQIVDYYVISDDLLNHIKSQIEVIEHDSV